MSQNTKVKCNVENCKYYENHLCSLKVLDISSIVQGKKCHDKKETICSSFVQKTL